MQHAKNFATLVNTSVGVKEMVHRIFKGMVGHTNHKNVEMDLMRRYNTVQALRHLVDGSEDPHFPGKTWIMQVPAKACLHQLLSDWYATGTPLLEEANNADIEGLEFARLLKSLCLRLYLYSFFFFLRKFACYIT